MHKCKRKRPLCRADALKGQLLCERHFSESVSALRNNLVTQLEKPNGEDGCWLWTGAKQQTGYGIMNTLGITRRPKTVHWVALYLSQPAQFDLDGHGEVHHLCKTPACANPGHLVHVQTSFHELLHQLSNRRVAGIVLDHLLESYPAAATELAALRLVIEKH